MTVHLQCDYCGQSIDDNHYVKINALGRRSERYGSSWEVVNEYLGHFHANQERDCYADLWERMCLVLDTHSELEAIPTVGKKATAEVPSAPARESQDQAYDDWREEREAWKRVPRDEKFDLVLSALGDDRLRITALLQRMKPDFPGIYDAELRRLLNQLLERGDVIRVPDHMHGKQQWYAYQRPHPDVEALEGAQEDGTSAA